jgi:hypothetical protein
MELLQPAPKEPIVVGSGVLAPFLFEDCLVGLGRSACLDAPELDLALLPFSLPGPL